MSVLQSPRDTKLYRNKYACVGDEAGIEDLEDAILKFLLASLCAMAVVSTCAGSKQTMIN